MNIKLNKDQRISINNSEDIYLIMKQILLRENKYGQNKEHFWVVGLNNDNKILYIELVSLGSVTMTIIKPNEVFRLAAQKLAVSVILVHNHPSGRLEPSEEDKDITDRLIQAAKIVDTEVIDHLIISTENHYSFVDTDLFAELQKSTKWVPRYVLEDRLQEEKLKLKSEIAQNKLKEKKGINKGIEQGRKQEKIQIAKEMKKESLEINTIVKLTGLSLEEIERIGNR